MNRLRNRQESGGFARKSYLLNKVPEITLFFWIIKVFCTTVGETVADFLNVQLHLGLTGTTVVMASLLGVVFFFQFAARRYIPGVYWLAVVLISIVGTLLTDNLTDNLGVSLVSTTCAFGGALVATFALWYASEKTLSVHVINTWRREGFYWLAILFTFALGTATGDLLAERFDLGYAVSSLLFGGAIAVVALAHLRFKLSAVLAFWIAYILTRPLGASLGDYLSQAREDGGLGLGTTLTSALFLGVILLTVISLTMTRKEPVLPARTAVPAAEHLPLDPQSSVAREPVKTAARQNQDVMDQ